MAYSLGWNVTEQFRGEYQSNTILQNIRIPMKVLINDLVTSMYFQEDLEEIAAKHLELFDLLASMTDEEDGDQ